MIVIEILRESWGLLFEMAPYLMLGMTIAGILNFLITREIIVKQIGLENIFSVIKSSLLGVPLPLCSCGVVPTAISMKKLGASNSSVISFLISTPQTGVDSILATYGMLGPVFAIFRPVVALVMGIVGGAVNLLFGEKKKNEKKEKSVHQTEKTTRNFSQKAVEFLRFSYFDFMDDIVFQFIIGLLVAGIISYTIPDDFFQNSFFNYPFFNMILMVLISVPMYICATSSIPIAVALMLKGFTPGAAYVFLVAGPATNAASLLIIYKALGKKSTLIYLFTIISLSLFFGSLLDYLIHQFDLEEFAQLYVSHHHGNDFNLFLAVVSYIFLALLVNSLIKKMISKIKSKASVQAPQWDIILTVKGMRCQNCVENLKSHLELVNGIEKINIDLDSQEVFIKGQAQVDWIVEAINQAGYSFKNLSYMKKKSN